MLPGPKPEVTPRSSIVSPAVHALSSFVDGAAAVRCARDFLRTLAEPCVALDDEAPYEANECAVLGGEGMGRSWVVAGRRMRSRCWSCSCERLCHCSDG